MIIIILFMANHDQDDQSESSLFIWAGAGCRVLQPVQTLPLIASVTTIIATTTIIIIITTTIIIMIVNYLNPT